MSAEIYTVENAPEGSRKLLQDTKDKLGGFLPNLYGQMAGSPAVLEAYLDLSSLLSKTSFSPAEQQMILLTVSVRNGCKYCVGAHSSGARIAKLDKEIIGAIRDGQPVSDPRLQSLREFAEIVLETRGKVDEKDMNSFIAAGFNKTHAMELLIGVGMKALSNSFARMFETPLDGMLEKMAWEGNDRV
jgi:uncharacterized peroxidase-related enzyme